MEKIFLVIVFMAGLKHSVNQWQYIYGTLIELSIIKKRGYNSTDYPDCLCDACKNKSQEEKEKHKENNFNADYELLVTTITDATTYGIFITGITLIILHIIFN